MDYPSNSNEEEPKNVQKVIEGKAVIRKKTLGRKFSETFFGGENAQGVWSYVLFEVMVPAAKDMIVDAGSEALQRSFYGSSRTSRRSGARNSSTRTGQTNYNKMSQPNERPRMSHRARQNHDFEELVLPSRQEALEVLDNLYNLISQYNVATVADLYELAGVTASFTDQKYGWTELRGADVVKTRAGFIVDLPRPKVLD